MKSELKPKPGIGTQSLGLAIMGVLCNVLRVLLRAVAM